MSQFIEKLSRLSQGVSQPIGFGPRQPTPPRTRIQLVASLPQENAESLVNHIAGADAAMATISEPGSGSQTLKKLSQTVADIPWGVWLKTTTQVDIKPLIEAGGDFFVFPAAVPLTTFNKEKVGKILEVGDSLNEGLLRVLNGLPIDAVFFSAEEKENYQLTWQHLMLFQRLAGSLTKPLLVAVPAQVTGNELQTLWEAGVYGIVVAVTTDISPERFRELRQTIDGLTFPAPRRKEKAEPLLPRISVQPSQEAEEEEEEE